MLDPLVVWGLLWGFAYAATVTGTGNLLPLFFLAVCVAAVFAGANLESIDGVMIGLTLGLLPSVALAASQLLGWSPVEQSTPPGGLFYSRGVFSETVAPVFVWWCARGHRGLGPAALLAGPVLLSRVAMLAAAVGMIYAAPVRFRYKVTACLILVIGAMASLWAFGDGRLHSGFLRIAIWKIALAQVTPIGHGLGWFATTYPMLLTAHSDLLQAFGELGIGAVAFIAAGIYIWTRETGEIGERAAFISLAVEATVSFPLHMPTAAFLGCVLAGYLGRRRGRPRNAQSDSGLADAAGA